MAETSFPIIEEPLTDQQWGQVTSGIGDGVLDRGGSPYNFLNISNVNNTAEITVSTTTGVAEAILRGFYHKLDENRTISLPAVATATTYYVVLQYDPVRATAGGLPVTLEVLTTLDRSGGKSYLVLYEIDRSPNQLLTDVTRRWVRPRVSPTLTVSRGRELPDPASTMRYALGLIHGGAVGVTDLRMNLPGGWASLLSPEWVQLPDVASATYGTTGQRLAIQRVGTTRKMRGRFGRDSGANYLASNTTGYIIAYLAPEDTPTATSRHLVYAGGDVLAYVTFFAGDSQIRVSVTRDAGWIDLGTIEWQVPEVN